MSQKRWVVEIGYSAFGNPPAKWRLAETAFGEYRSADVARSEAMAQHRENPYHYIRVRRTDEASAPVMFYPTPEDYGWIE